MATIESSAEAAVLDKVPKLLFIAGAWREATGGGTLDVIDPSTGERIAAVADATPEDAMDALAAAHETFGEWKESAPRDRADILHAAYDLVTEHSDELALLMTLEMG